MGIGGLYLGRVLQGIGEACLYTGAAAWTVEVAGIHRSARALGYLSSGIWGGIAAGPLIGQLLGSFNRAAAFQVCAALAAAALLTQVPEDYQPRITNAEVDGCDARWCLPGSPLGSSTSTTR